MSNINDFKDLIIWQKGMDIAQRYYFLTKLFPKDELCGMVQQVRRSAVSRLIYLKDIEENMDVEVILNLLKEKSRMIISLFKKN